MEDVDFISDHAGVESFKAGEYVTVTDEDDRPLTPTRLRLSRLR